MTNDAQQEHAISDVVKNLVAERDAARTALTRTITQRDELRDELASHIAQQSHVLTAERDARQRGALTRCRALLRFYKRAYNNAQR